MISYHTQERRGKSEPWEMLPKAQGRLRKAKIHRGGERETEINDNVVWWQSWESCSALVVSPSTNSSRREWIFVWIGFNLPIRQCEAGSMLWVFSILPQENCVKSYKCTSIMLYISTALWQAACSYKELTKPWTERIDCWEMSLQKHMTTENKKQSDSSAGSQKLSVHWAEMIYFQLLKWAMHTSSTPTLITNGYRVV